MKLSNYETLVCEYLVSKVPWLKSCESYPEISGQIDTPAAFFSTQDFDKSSTQKQNDQLTLDYKCELILVMGVMSKTHQKQVRDAAVAMCLELNDCRFGLSIEPAEIVGSHPSSLEPSLDEYVTWTINFKQTLTFGDDAYRDSEFFLTQAAINESVDGKSDHVYEIEGA